MKARHWWRAALACAVLAGLAAGCGGGGGSDTAVARSEPKAANGGGALRPVIDGMNLLTPKGTPLRLRGVNLQGLTDDEAANIAMQFNMNFVRLRISYTPENRDTSTPSGFKAKYLEQVDQWVAAARARRLWMLLELRVNDDVSKSPDFYDTSKLEPCADDIKPERCPNFGGYLRAWQALAQRYRGVDYVAGYGLLAEPSADKAGVPDPVETLVNFHRTLMQAISLIDARTPFFIGPNYNYDTMEYIDPRYLIEEFRGRLVYEVNFLMPKEWVQDGSWTVPCDGTAPCAKPTYPFPAPDDGYDSLLADPLPGERMPHTFNRQRTSEANYRKTLSRGFVPWYLQWARDFRKNNQVPLLVDQFGASSLALGQIDYERDLIEHFEQEGLHWSRWSYNASGDEGTSRTLEVPPNDAVNAFYTSLAPRWGAR